MQMRVRLPEEVVSILSAYGDISSVANTILDAWEYGEIISCIIPRDNDKRYTLNIHSQVYESNRKLYGATSNRCSIRGILCEVAYNMLDWLDTLMLHNKKDTNIELLLYIQNLLHTLYSDTHNEHILRAEEEVNEAIKSYKV